MFLIFFHELCCRKKKVRSVYSHLFHQIALVRLLVYALPSMPALLTCTSIAIHVLTLPKYLVFGSVTLSHKYVQFMTYQLPQMYIHVMYSQQGMESPFVILYIDSEHHILPRMYTYLLKESKLLDNNIDKKLQSPTLEPKI